MSRFNLGYFLKGNRGAVNLREKRERERRRELGGGEGREAAVEIYERIKKN